VKARRVKGLDPQATLADNLERIVHVRVDELASFAPQALDPRNVTALHDMRIAAKRLRYILEVGAEPCFGAYAETAMKRTRELQDLLGEIHDCDVQRPRVLALMKQLRDDDLRAVRERAGDAEDLEPRLAAGAPHAPAWRGLHALTTYLGARRALLFERFLELWTRLEREGFRARLEYAVSERPAAGPSPAPADTALDADPVAFVPEPT
jgi:CHAD domain-containing protein